MHHTLCKYNVDVMPLWPARVSPHHHKLGGISYTIAHCQPCFDLQGNALATINVDKRLQFAKTRWLGTINGNLL